MLSARTLLLQLLSSNSDQTKRQASNPSGGSGGEIVPIKAGGAWLVVCEVVVGHVETLCDAQGQLFVSGSSCSPCWLC